MYRLVLFKACVRYFLSNLYFSLNDSPKKTMKIVFYLTLFDLGGEDSLPPIKLLITTQKVVELS